MVKCAGTFIRSVNDNHTFYCLKLVKVLYHRPDCQMLMLKNQILVMAMFWALKSVEKAEFCKRLKNNHIILLFRKCWSSNLALIANKFTTFSQNINGCWYTAILHATNEHNIKWFCRAHLEDSLVNQYGNRVRQGVLQDGVHNLSKQTSKERCQ